MRGLDRAAVTRIYNTRETFSTFDSLKRKNTALKLENLRKKILDSDRQIAELKFNAQVTDAELQLEIEECESYSDKMDMCTNMLITEETLPISQPDRSEGPRSLLKSPQAPLPVFHSEPGEDFEAFIRNFEETTGKFRTMIYSCY